MNNLVRTCFLLTLAWGLSLSTGSARFVSDSWGDLDVSHNGDFELVSETNGWLVVTGGSDKTVLRVRGGLDGQKLAIDSVRKVIISDSGDLEALVIGTIEQPGASGGSLAALGFDAGDADRVSIHGPNVDFGLVAAKNLSSIQAGSLAKLVGGFAKGSRIRANEDIGGPNAQSLGYIGAPSALESSLGLGRTTIRTLQAKGRIDHVVVYAQAAQPGKTRINQKDTDEGLVYALDPSDFSDKSKNVQINPYSGAFPDDPGAGTSSGGSSAGSSSAGSSSGGGSSGGGISGTGGGTGGSGSSSGGSASAGSATGTGTAAGGSTGSGSLLNGTIVGIVFSAASSNRVNAARVLLDGRQVTANGDGYFFLSDVTPTDRALLRVEAAGYVETTESVPVVGGETSEISLFLQPVGVTSMVPSATGGTITNAVQGGAVTLPPNAVVTATGQPFDGPVSVSVTTYDPTDPLELVAFPGEFIGVRSGTGAEVNIKSFGWMDVTLRDALNNPLQLAPGQQATLTVPIPPGLQGVAPNTIPLWFFDHTDGRWKEEGSATRSGGVYVGAVSHFTPWNCDDVMNCGRVQGRVVTSDLMPVVSAEVRITGPGWVQRAYTRSDGTWGPLCVEPGATYTIQAFKGSARSSIGSGAGPAADTTQSVPDLILDAEAKIVVALTWGSDPSDLDAHVTGPTSGTNRFHVYYSTRVAEGTSLDTDDTSGFGPEVVRVARLNPGVYRYSVHHYSGVGTLSTSGLRAVMTVQGLGVYSAEAPAGALGAGDAWAVWDIDVSGGQVTAVRVVNTIRNAIGSSDAAGFSP